MRPRGNLVMLLGPMYSGKTTVLIHRVDSLVSCFPDEAQVVVYQSKKNDRDETVQTRNGLKIESSKIESITSISQIGHKAIGIDELHMFNSDDENVILEMVAYIDKMLELGMHIVASGLNCDYRGEPYALISALQKLEGARVFPLYAVCNRCDSFKGEFTQILQLVDGKLQPVTGGLPAVLSEDVGLVYQARCSKCFVHAEIPVEM